MISVSVVQANSGTSYLEQEYKTEILSDELPTQVISKFTREMNDYFINIMSKKNDFYLTKQPYDFIFTDLYADTNNYDLFLNNQSYRFRRRYKYPANKVVNITQIEEVIAKSLPVRAEVQLKIYKHNLAEQKFTNEYRYEFPKELLKSDLLRKEDNHRYIHEILQSGTFNGVSFQQIEKLEEFHNKKIYLGQLFKHITHRTRYHINSHSNQGSGNNPQHSILISLDISYFYSETKSPIGPFYELEVELERNKLQGPMNKSIKGLSDLSLIQKNIFNFIIDRFKLDEVKVSNSLKSKYQRIIKIVHPKAYMKKHGQE